MEETLGGLPAFLEIIRLRSDSKGGFEGGHARWVIRFLIDFWAQNVFQSLNGGVKFMMDSEEFLASVAAHLPNLVSMISLFKNERASRKDLTHREFLEWLENHRHEEIKSLILNVHGLTDEIDRVLLDRTETIQKDLWAISAAIADVAASLESFKGLVSRLRPTQDLSNQAKYILREFALSRAHEMMLQEAGRKRILLNGVGRFLNDDKFLIDDLNELERRKLIRKESSVGKRPLNNVTRFYSLTRIGKELGLTIPEQEGVVYVNPNSKGT